MKAKEITNLATDFYNDCQRRIDNRNSRQKVIIKGVFKDEVKTLSDNGNDRNSNV